MDYFRRVVIVKHVLLMEISLSCHHGALNVITFVTGNRTHFDLLACQTNVRYLGSNYIS